MSSDSIGSSHILHSLVEKAYEDLQALSSSLMQENLDTRREELLSYIRIYRARFLKVYIAIRYLSDFGHKNLITDAKQALEVVSDHRNKVNEAQDRLYFMHGDLFRARQSRYDISTSLDVLITGSYNRLPLGIKQCGSVEAKGSLYPHETSEQKKEILDKVHHAIKVALISREEFPKEFSYQNIREGILHLKANEEFELWMSLDEIDPNSKWIFRDFKLGVKARIGEKIDLPIVDARHKDYLSGVVQKAMDATTVCDHNDEKNQKVNKKIFMDRPLYTAYRVMHDYCLSLQMELLSAQASYLSKENEPWHKQMRFEFDRKGRILDIAIWPNEFKYTKPNQLKRNIKNEFLSTNQMKKFPEQCKFVRVFLEEAEDIGDHENNSTNTLKLKILRGNENEVFDETDRLCDILKPNSSSCSLILRQATNIFVMEKLVGLIPELESAVAISEIKGAKVSKIFDGRALRVEVCGCFQVDLTVDARSGKFIILNKRGLDQQKFSNKTSLLHNTLHLNPKFGVKPYQNWLDDLKSGLVQALTTDALNLVSSISVSKLGLVSESNWGGLLGRAGSEPQLTSTYVVVSSVYEESAEDIPKVFPPIFGTAAILEIERDGCCVFGISWSKDTDENKDVCAVVGESDGLRRNASETIFLVLEVVANEKLDLECNLLVAVLKNCSKNIRPICVGSMEIPKQLTVSSLQQESADEFDSNHEQAICYAADFCYQKLPWIRAYRSLVACGMKIIEENLEMNELKLQTLQNHFFKLKQHDSTGWKWEGANNKKLPPFSGKSLDHGNQRQLPLLWSLTLTDDKIELVCDLTVQLSVQARLVSSDLTEAVRSLSEWKSEAMDYLLKTDQTRKNPSSFIVSDVGDYCIGFRSKERNGERSSRAFLSHCVFCKSDLEAKRWKVNNSQDLVFVLPEEFSKHSCDWLKFLVERNCHLSDIVEELGKAAAMAADKAH